MSEQALLDACEAGSFDTALVFLNKGYEVNCHDDLGLTPLHYAAKCGHMGLVRLLLDRGADIEAVGIVSGTTPLTMACEFGNKKIVKQLLALGANPEFRDFAGATPSDITRCRSCSNLLEQHEKKRDVDPETPGRNSEIHAATLSPLHFAAWSGQIANVLRLLRAGHDINRRTEDGKTPLHLAVENGQEVVVTILLERGADKEANDSEGKTPLHIAAENDFPKIVELLLSMGVNPVSETDEFWPRTALDIAKDLEHFEVRDVILNWTGVKVLQRVTSNVNLAMFGASGAGTPGIWTAQNSVDIEPMFSSRLRSSGEICDEHIERWKKAAARRSSTEISRGRRNLC